MTPSPSPRTRAHNLVVSLALAATVASTGRVQADTTATPDAVRRAVEAGLENVSADSVGGRLRIAYENRRYRHPANALWRLQQQHPGSFTAVERRLGLAAAAINVSGFGDSSSFRVRYPSDPNYPGEPSRSVAEPTTRSVDLLLRPVFAYELGHLTVPIQVQIQLEPMVRYNPWRGARATASLLVPLYTQFEFDPVHPDMDNVRPGVFTLDQFAWIRRAALVSASAGLLGDNRYGGSIGAARPFAGGRFMADAQLDLTGFVAFEDAGFTYSNPRQWSGYAGVSWAVPRFDAIARIRGGQFLYGDRGAQFDLRRSYGDFEYSLFVLRTIGTNVEGVRVTVPVPPMTRATQRRVRVQPIERFSIGYRTNALPVGIFVSGVASRDEYLRHLTEPGLDANRFRMNPTSRPPALPDTGEVAWVNHSGMSGFVFTPWAGVLPDRTVSVDYTDVPAKWSYSGRGEFVNQAYSLTIALLPRIEASLRFTRVPGAYGLIPDDVDNLLSTNTDHEASGRLVLLIPRNGFPGLAVGVDDISGTRLYHSTYAVAGLPLKIKLMQTRFSFGYAPRVFTATRHVLDGGFGALEVSPWRVVAARVEYDSEKWNVGTGVVLPFGLRLRAAVLNLETLSAGAGWTHKL